MHVHFAPAGEELLEFLPRLGAGLKEWDVLTRDLAARVQANPEELGAAAVDYLFYSGYVALAYWWARAVATADAGSHPEDFKTMKRETARFYFARILPRIHTHAAVMRSGPSSLMNLDAALFDS